MADVLLELRSEEIPARMQDRARDDLARLFAAELARAGLAAASVVTYATPRRLALIARDLPAETAAVSEEIKGPKTTAPPQALEGFLRKTGLTQDQLTTRDGTYFAVTEKPGRATAAVLAEAIPAIVRAFPWPKSMRWGEASASTESLRWVRPLHGIVALLGSEVVPVTVAGIASGAETRGHRFHAPGAIAIRSAADYAEQLRAAHVIVDQDERRALIRERAAALAAEAGLELIEDEGLVAENAGLTEWPVPLLGRFDEAFLDVPPEVIQLTARVNQKYFVCRDAGGSLAGSHQSNTLMGALANAFICTANIAASDGGALIVEGNRKVLAARLADARFFYETDLKVPLEDQAKKLDRIVFHEKLGTVADKVDRVAKLARWLVEEGIVSPSVRVERSRDTSPGEAGTRAADRDAAPSGPSTSLGTNGDRAHLADLAERAARLAKTDLVTGMVGEFPELQGIMGGYYAAAQGEDPAIAGAIREHYKPVGQGDEVPTAPVTAAVSLADKLDTLVTFFAVDEKPTGSKDPFALRRTALSILRLLTALQLRADFSSLIRAAYEGLVLLPTARPTLPVVAFANSVSQELTSSGSVAGPFDIAVTLTASSGRFVVRKELSIDSGGGTLVSDVKNFVVDACHEVVGSTLSITVDRLKVQQREAGVRHDLIDAVFALGGEDDLVRLLARVRALQAFVGTEDGANLLAGYKRAANILKKEGIDAAPPATPASAGVTMAPSYPPEPAEADLITALDAAEPAAARAVADEDFEGAMTALAGLRAPIDAFFDGVTVNDPDREKRAARLALLARVRAAVHTVADFSKIEG